MAISKEALILAIEEKVSSNGNKFLSVTYNSVEGKGSILVWDGIGDALVNLKTGSVYVLTGSFNDSYPKLEKYVWSPTPVSNFVESTYTLEQAEHILNIMLSKITDPILMAINNNLFTTEFKAVFFKGVGGKKQHHSRMGDLLRHSFEVFSHVYAICNTKPFSTVVDMQAALQGALCHDIGKPKEYDVDDFGNVEFTKWIDCAGHAVLGSEMVHDAFKQIDMGQLKMGLVDSGSTSEQADATIKLGISRFENVKHIIRSHHGLSEFGAIVKACTLEATQVFLADMMSAAYDKSISVQFDEKTGVGTSGLFRDKFVKF